MGSKKVLFASAKSIGGAFPYPVVVKILTFFRIWKKKVIKDFVDYMKKLKTII